MRFTETPLPGVMLIELEPFADERGSFSRVFCDDEFARAGIAMPVRQANLSRNPHALTLRGMHYQAAPHGESKLVQCVHGRIFDVAIDLRPASPSYRRWFGVELGPALQRMLFIPEGCAHGFLTLEDASDVVYLVGEPYVREAGRGVRWDDPAFGVAWPESPRIVSSRDQSFPHFTSA